MNVTMAKHTQIMITPSIVIEEIIRVPGGACVTSVMLPALSMSMGRSVTSLFLRLAVLILLGCHAATADDGHPAIRDPRPQTWACDELVTHIAHECRCKRVIWRGKGTLRAYRCDGPTELRTVIPAAGEGAR